MRNDILGDFVDLDSSFAPVQVAEEEGQMDTDKSTAANVHHHF